MRNKEYYVLVQNKEIEAAWVLDFEVDTIEACRHDIAWQFQGGFDSTYYIAKFNRETGNFEAYYVRRPGRNGYEELEAVPLAVRTGPYRQESFDKFMRELRGEGH